MQAQMEEMTPTENSEDVNDSQSGYIDIIDYPAYVGYVTFASLLYSYNKKRNIF